MKRKLIILTDPGQDEAAAILMILGAADVFDVLGLVATAGNIDLGHTTNNCLKLLELAQRPDIPVFAGCPRSMRRALVTATHLHGPTGLDGPGLPEPSIAPATQHGVDFIIETLRAAAPSEIIICSLSPLTNLAMALILAPDITRGIGEVVAMAGAYFEVGNITPAAEFNVYVDPEAADVVLRSGVKLTLLPLDVTHQMLSTPTRLQTMRDLGNACGVATAQMLEFSQAFDLKKYGKDGAPRALRSSLHVAARSVLRTTDQRDHRDELRTDPGNDRRRLVGDNRSAEERLLRPRRRSRGLLRPAEPTPRAAAMSGTLFRDTASLCLATISSIRQCMSSTGPASCSRLATTPASAPTLIEPVMVAAKGLPATAS
jgi:purine nucleosidase